MTDDKTAASVTFADLGVSTATCEALEQRSITAAFPIQAATIEAALAGRDICGKAPTGSGKTLAFGIPTVELVSRLEPAEPYFPHALILAPTRELATQIKEEIESSARAHNRSVVTVFGGTSIKRDINRLHKPVDILVACPGRLEDLISRRCVELRKTSIVVLDEADRMADMGFLPSVKRILDLTAKGRTTLLFSATLDGDVDTLIHRYQNNPHMVEVEAQVEERGHVEHSWYLIEPNDRIDSAAAVLRSYYSSIVFCRTRRGCDRVAKMLKKRGLETVAIHGDRSQAQRERALRSFTSGKAQVMVATDVAARGIHVDNVSLVMHYDPAATDKDHVHRSGRTGRAGQDGRVISMVVTNKAKLAKSLQRQLGEKVGFDDFDIDKLDDAGWVANTEVDEDTERRSDRSKSRGRGSRSERERNSRGQGGRGGRNSRDRNARGRGRNSRDGRDGRDGRDRDDRDRFDDDRYGDKKRRFRPKRNARKKNDWYPRGYFDQDDDRSRRSNNRGRSHHSGNRNRRFDNDRFGNDRYGSDRFERDDNREGRGGRRGQGRNFEGRRGEGRRGEGRNSEGRRGRGRGGRGYDRGANSEYGDGRERKEYGGSNTKQRKPRSQKGRHADRAAKRNKGKRRG